jgi:hypothetical protein
MWRNVKKRTSISGSSASDRPQLGLQPDSSIIQSLGTTPKNKPFIVNVAPALLDGASPRACRIYMTLLRRADGQSGDLKIPCRKGNKAEPVWLKATQFDREARMSKPTRLKAMRELVALGLVTIVRPRVRRMIGGRMRAVAGPTHYTVHRAPVVHENHQKPAHSSKVKGHPPVQKANSSAVEELYPQILSTTPSGPSRGSAARAEDVSRWKYNKRCHQHLSSDDARVSTSSEAKKNKPKAKATSKAQDKPRAETLSYEERLNHLLADALAILHKKYPEHSIEDIRELLHEIAEKAGNSFTTIQSANYFVRSFENAFVNAEEPAGACTRPPIVHRAVDRIPWLSGTKQFEGGPRSASEDLFDGTSLAHHPNPETEEAKESSPAAAPCALAEERVLDSVPEQSSSRAASQLNMDERVACAKCGGILHAWLAEEGLQHVCPRSADNVAAR